jgi:hypothetical protein
VDAILEIDHESGELLYTYGHLEGAWGFDPEDSAFYWQHGAYFLENGNLLTSCQPGNSERLFIREYERNEEDQTTPIADLYALMP